MSSTPKPDRRRRAVFEMALVFTIVGSAITMALPAYGEFTLRGKVADVIASAGSAKATVEEFAAASGELPSTESISLPFVDSRYVLSSLWAATGAVGTITITTRPLATETELSSKKITLTATYNAATKQVDWVCGGTSATTVDSTFLPAECK
jgi:type IV pilus assembly protein PilA